MAQPLVEVARLDEKSFYSAEPQPHDVFKRLREQVPVFWYEPGEFWALSKYEDVRFVSSHPELFSSAYGSMATESNPPDEGIELDESEMPRRAMLRRNLALAKMGGGTEYMVASDPPRHTFLRKIVSYAFTPRVVAALEKDVQDLTTECLDRVVPGTLMDFVDVLAAPLPLYVIAQMFGVPKDRWAQFRIWSDAGVVTHDETDVNKLAMGAQHLMEMAMYFSEELAERRRNPRQDLLTALTQADVEGEGLSEWNQLMMITLLLLAGNETTRSLLSGAVKALADHPDQRALLVAQPELIPDAVEELLRYVTPVTTFARTATERVEIRGQVIEKGDFVLMLYQAANRDEDVWDEPDKLDVTRGTDGHLAFGFGTHFCLGTSLARREARTALTDLLRRFPDYELAGPVTRFPSTITPGIDKMPIRF